MLIAGIQAIFSFGTGFDGLPVYQECSGERVKKVYTIIGCDDNNFIIFDNCKQGINRPDKSKLYGYSRTFLTFFQGRT